MERLVELAAARGGQAEAYVLSVRRDSVRLEGGEIHDVESSRLSGTSLRLLEDGRLGFAFTRNLSDPAALVARARESLAGGAVAAYDLPRTEGVPALPTHDPSADDTTAADIAAECRRVHDLLAGKVSAEVSVDASNRVTRLGIRNSAGTDLAAVRSGWRITVSATYPASGSGFLAWHHARRPEPMPEERIDEIARLYEAGLREVRPRGGRMKVLFLLPSLWALTWRLIVGTSARSVVRGISPLADRVGDRVLDAKLTIVDTPRDVSLPGARAFDDEGVACERFPVFEDGVLRGFPTDLHHAAKLGVEPNGHGFRTALFGGDPLTLRPTPWLGHLSIGAGDATLDDLLAAMDRGLVVGGVLGAHSGNVPNGDYTMGASPALYVERGEIAGRVTDAMVAGNVYETLSHVVAVGRERRHAFDGNHLDPLLLCDGVSVACG